MPKVILNPAVKGLTGKTTISKVPDMTKVKWSKAQRRRFKKAVASVQGLRDNPKVWAVYQKIATRRHKRAWDLAMSDYFGGLILIADL